MCPVTLWSSTSRSPYHNSHDYNPVIAWAKRLMVFGKSLFWKCTSPDATVLEKRLLQGQQRHKRLEMCRQYDVSCPLWSISMAEVPVQKGICSCGVPNLRLIFTSINQTQRGPGRLVETGNWPAISALFQHLTIKCHFKTAGCLETRSSTGFPGALGVARLATHRRKPYWSHDTL